MAHSILKTLLGKRSEMSAWLQMWADTTNTEIAIEDNRSMIVFGTMPTGDVHSFPIVLENLPKALFMKGIIMHFC